MAKIALANATITQSTIADHINYTKLETTGYTPTYPIYDSEGNQTGTGGGNPIKTNVPYKTSAKIDGTITATVTNVKIEGKAPIVNGDSTKENDSYTIPSGGTYTGGSHSNATGKVTSGNSNKVNVNGKSVAIKTSTITTHAGNSTTVNTGVSTTVNIG